MLIARSGRGAAWLTIALLAVIGVAVRVNNAFQYKMLWGFDAKFNWRYIVTLLNSWELPAPDADWSTSHPPFFYYLGAALCRLISSAEVGTNVIALRLFTSLIGLGMIALAAAYVRRMDPENSHRLILASGLLLFLPVHIYMSAMLTEEILASTLISIVLVGVAWPGSPASEGPTRASWYVAALGAVAGLAFLTKLTGILVFFAVAGAYLLGGYRRGELRRAISMTMLFGAITGLVGGWYYLRNLIGWGYIYPYGLELHQIMFTMPPGDRQILDFFRIPLATWTDPQVLHPDLLRSIWGSTYVTLWFDGHRHFLPTADPNVTRAGTLILTLGMLPTVAFFIGLGRGVRRAIRSSAGPDTLFLLMIAITLLGYCAFAWRNPWFVVLKASFLLSLSVPFAYYASEVLADWTRAGGVRAALVWATLSALVVCVIVTFTSSEQLWNMRHMTKPGVVW